jgi:hypothetical protein
MSNQKKHKKEDNKTEGSAHNKTAMARIQAGLEVSDVGDAERGRPTKYKKEYAQDLLDYFKKNLKAYEREVVPNGEGRTRTEVTPLDLPTFQEFAAIHCNVCVDTLLEWTKAKNEDGSLKFPSFSEAYKRARDIQTAILIKGGMVGVYDARFAGLASKNLIGWSEKVESTVTEVPGMTIQEKADLEATYQLTLEAAKKAKAKKGGCDMPSR